MKSFGSLRARIIVFFTVFMLILCAVFAVMSLWQSFDVASLIFARQGIGITEEIAREMINPAVFTEIINRQNPYTPQYLTMQRDLFEKRRNAAGALFLYTIAPVNGLDGDWIYVVDGSDAVGGENFSALGAPVDIDSFEKVFWTALETKTSQYSHLVMESEYRVYIFSVYTPIVNAQCEVIGMVGCDFAADEIIRVVTSEMLRQVILALILAAAGIAVMLIFMGMIFPRLKQVTMILRSITEGEGDLRSRIDIKGRDEIGTMADYFNRTLDKIRGMIILVREQSGLLGGVGNELAANMTQTATAINQITANIQELKERVMNQSGLVNGTGVTMERITASIERLNAHVKEQAESVAQSSAAIEEMLANIQSVTGTLVKNAENVRELSSASAVGRRGLEEVSADIKEIARASAGLFEINAVMENISGQTNLLSMNAAIEAAHAGEAGKGFAVVAGEIRKLAENSGGQSKVISEVLTKIKGSIDKIIRSTDSVMGKFQAIDDQVQTVSEQEERIRSAMEEQGEGSKRILEAVGRLNEITQQVQQSSQDMLEGSREVIEQSKNLEQVTSEITGGITEMAGGAEQINAAVTRVNEISGENRQGITSLQAEMAKFQVE